MNKPIFLCDGNSVSVEQPRKSNPRNEVTENSTRSLGGRELSDVMSFKHSYVLEWEHMRNSEYEDLLELYEHHLSSGVNVTFTWPKYPRTSTGIECKMRISEAPFVAGSGSEFFFQKVQIILTEIESRI